MLDPTRSAHPPAGFWALAALYTVASLAHFAHNAEYIAFYPGMPSWLTREKVYLAWLAVASVGALGWFLVRFKRSGLGFLVLGVYGALGLDGLAHYTLALCSEHTFAANLSIWAEASTGLALLLACFFALSKRLRAQLVLGGATQGKR